jgi:hypothetical protein
MARITINVDIGGIGGIEQAGGGGGEARSIWTSWVVCTIDLQAMGLS